MCHACMSTCEGYLMVSNANEKCEDNNGGNLA